MKLVIDIPEEDYIRLRDEGMFGNVTTFKRAVREGIPLAEQEPCTDAISRQAVLEKIHEAPYINDCSNIGMLLEAWINRIPSVKPQYTDAEIQKMQDLEFAEIQKAYEIGKEEGSSEKPNKWIPVSERLPEAEYPVIVTWMNNDPASYYQYILGKHYTGVAHYKNNKWYWYSSVTEDVLMEYGRCDSEEFDEAIEVIAWMPLPEPYKQEVDNNGKNNSN